MTVIRVGVQSPAGGAGQLVDLDGPGATIASITNASGESVQYSLDGGSVWATLATAASSGSVGTVRAGLLRMRKVSSGAYPAPVDVDATINGLEDGWLTPAQVAATQALVSGAGIVETAGARAVSVGALMADADRLMTTRGRPLMRWQTPTAVNGGAGATMRAAGMAEPSLGLCARLDGKAGTGSRPYVIAPIYGAAASSVGVNGVLMQIKAPLRSNPAALVVLRIRLCSDATTSNWYGATILVSADGLEHWIAVSSGAFTAGQGTFVVGTSTITHVMVEDRNDPANLEYDGLLAGESAYIGQVYLSPKGRAKAMIRFDDGFGSLTAATATFAGDGITQAWSAQTLLRQYGMRGSVALSSKRTGATNPLETFLSWANVKSLYDDGWDVFIQSHNEPVDALQNGARLLGPYGYTTRAVASVDASANTITSSAVHSIVPSPTYSNMPVEFVGTDLPAPLVTGAIYFSRYSTTTAFTLHPTDEDAAGNTNVIDLTTTGTPANFGWRYGGSASDSSAILADYRRCQELIIANNVAGAHDIVALNQGAADQYVMAALSQLGASMVWGTNGSAGGVSLNGSRLTVGQAGDSRGLNTRFVGGPNIQIPGGVQTETAALAARQYVQTCCAAGVIFGNYHHRLTATNGPYLDAYLDELRLQQAAGAVDICTPSEVRDYLLAFRPPAVPISGSAI